LRFWKLAFAGIRQVSAAMRIEVTGSSHVAYMSHPKEAVKLIEEAATTANVSR
jgi:hypothetical protein